MSLRIDPESFLYGPNAPYIAELYRMYLQDTSSVAEDWQQFFADLGEEDAIGLRGDGPPQWQYTASSGRVNGGGAVLNEDQALDSIRALMLIRAYRVRGHLHARLDPLGVEKRQNHPELLPQTYGFNETDYDRPIFINHVLGLERATLRQILEKLYTTYCQTIGVEFMHIQEPDQKSWIQDRVENTPIPNRVDHTDRRQILQDLVAADSFERFLHVKYPGAKRFGLEGGESLIPGLQALLHRCVAQGVEKIVFGMAHRGRLSVLANVLEKPFQNIFAHFQGGDIDPTSVQGSGDVKYHLGYSSTRQISGHALDLTLMPNPSHLEAVDPVVLGKVRAEQALKEDYQRRRVLAVLMHGDAAFAGQGLVAETLELSALKGYLTGGTIHVIINNQIGFTTSPPHSRSSPYSSDLAKVIQAPIFHVNADDPEAVVWVMRLAADFQRQFARDVVVDMVCYRRHGHNEIDEPSFTQPRMYKAITQHPSTQKIYAKSLIEAGIMSEADVQHVIESYEAKLRSEFDSLSASRTIEIISTPAWLQGKWSNILMPNNRDPEFEMSPVTGIDHERLEEIGKALTHRPEGMVLNQRLERLLTTKAQVIESQGSIDWATAEAFAFGSLLLEGYPVRLSGQDCGRGTFSHRHAVWVDQETEEKYLPLNHIYQEQAKIEIVDSPLAEASVLGFEYGYSTADPYSLVLWEAQFGDFANGAQVMIDQFISSGEHKWYRLSGLVMLLPHGFEGQGPEHSSARLERYLQLCAEQNMRVVNCSTPANYFHALRRQIHSKTRKPLIVIAPKTLLRHKLAVSHFREMTGDTCFAPVIGDPSVKPNKVKRVILCSGKIYYELFQEREGRGLKDVALVRLEQYYPFPEKRLTEALKDYPNAEFIWCQEEPHNMGAWTFLDRRLERVLRAINAHQSQVIYVGRPEAASPATGNAARHEAEQSHIIRQAFETTATTSKSLFAL
jgi:2-oxoglutarate dehydrogenase E1 component